ncbi:MULTISPECIES: SBBP repeat-containing protein [unclassified Leptospira]|uniref:SBBP repeat-containing protein n=1 Tax=unclassified Leptospira TaxID=2633828 RepID=UPI000292579D|nr:MULTISPECIES: SBBP repeat-containing protein [unclassified Leptospira]EKO78279.1 beta-propeller repeat protein [Leptospira sp. Fiocruz LV3954]EMI65537.1 beta-propeller repeat protein [Leptospira sp. Fiocruz LV4135]
MSILQRILKISFLILFLIGTILTCKHEKKGKDDLIILSLLQLFSDITPGPKPEWTRLLGTSSSGGLQSNSITSDSSNNVYVTGQASGNFDGQSLTGVYDLFVTKFNSSGSKQWTRSMGVAGDETTAYAISSDAFGNVYSVGSTNGALDGQTFIGSAPDYIDTDLFIVKYDSNGNKQWTRLLGIAANSNTVAKAVTTDSSGNIFIAGSSNSGLDGQTFAGGGTGYFIVKYNSAGAKQWTKLYAGPSPSGIIYDNSNGKIYLVGATLNMTTMDVIPVSGANDSFLIQFDNNGNRIWTKLTGASGKDTKSIGATLDAQGNIYITGSTNGNIDDQVESGNNTRDLLVIKFDSNGNRLWTRQLGFTGSVFEISNKTAVGTGIVFDKNQSLYVTGYTTGNLDKQTHSDPRNAKHNVFIAKYDLNGNKIWTSISGTKGFYSDAYSITIDQLGHPYLTGYTNGPLNGETFVGTPSQTSDLLIIKY